MAADVVTPFDRGLEPVRKPHRAEERTKKRRAAFIIRIGHSRTPVEKLNAAVDYFRATVMDPRVDQAQVGPHTDHLVQTLIAAADQLAKTVRRTR
ncbi:hypothetical protein ACFPJ1_40815 [Kribbella qitaiheensis]|uniref:hypothetical protein n=1 Tax=Kribbella qitaiheensis TaxID=1544730 RepID=UPI0036143BFE